MSKIMAAEGRRMSEVATGGVLKAEFRGTIEAWDGGRVGEEGSLKKDI